MTTRAEYVCRYCLEPLQQLPKRWKVGDPLYCAAHEVLVDRDPVVIGYDALDFAEYLHDMGPDQMMHWPWPSMRKLAGPIVAGRVTYIAGFPGGGKTSVLALALRHWVRVEKKRVVYLPLEAHPGEVLTRFGCLELGIEPDDALSKRLAMRAHAGDEWARHQHNQLTEWFIQRRTDRELFEGLRIEPCEALTIPAFKKALDVARALEADLLVTDHVDHVEQDGGSDITASNAIQTMSLNASKRHGIPMLLATQLNDSRTGGNRLAHYQPPTTQFLYNKGKKDQIGAQIFGLSRVLLPSATDDQIRDVQKGQRDIGTIAMNNVMRINGMKLRYGTEHAGREILLGYTRGLIHELDDTAIRDIQSVQHGVHTGSPSNRARGGH